MPLVQKGEPAQDVLIWCAVAQPGMTPRLERLTEALRKEGVDYRISHGAAPTGDHPEAADWIAPDQIRNPRVVFFLDQYALFETGFLDSFHVFFATPDRLDPASLSAARVYADLVVVPTRNGLDDMRELFANARVLHQPWPTADIAQAARQAARGEDAPIRVLYAEDDDDERSAGSARQAVEAILACERTDLRFDLLFRAPLPAPLRARLEACDGVNRIVDHPVNARQMQDLLDDADLRLFTDATVGDGLEITQTLARGVVPAIPDAPPMREVVGPEACYLLDSVTLEPAGAPPRDRASTGAIADFLNDLDAEGLRRRSAEIARLRAGLADHAAGFGKMVRAVLAMNALAPPPECPQAEAAAPIAQCPWYRPYQKETRLIDVFMTTSRRADCFEQSLRALVEAVDASPYEHRISVVADGMDPGTDAVVARYRDRLFQFLWTSERQGLPLAWNNIVDLGSNMAARTERVPEFLCYLQDDCRIERPQSYFREMVEIAEAIDPARLGFVSGYHTEIHPGFGTATIANTDVILSDSVDGKNFMARPKVLHAIGKLSWWFLDGARRGNPGPDRGSHFDIWQWNESSRSLQVQGRVSAILPGLCAHLAGSAEASTWNNDTTEEGVAALISGGTLFRTR